MIRPNFEPIFSDFSEFCEKSSEKPVESFIPGQAITLKELVTRFERGQRLNVHSNFNPMDNMTRDHIYEESFDDAAPDDVHDVVDVHNFFIEHEQRKDDYKRKKKDQAQQAQQAPAQPAQSADPQPADPAK